MQSTSARLSMLFCLTALAACAQHHEGGAPATGGRPAPDPRSAAAPRRVTRAELLERLRVPLSRSDDGLRWQPHGARAARLDLRGRARHAVVARAGRDGQLRISCVDSLAGAERALADGADAP